FFSFAYAGQEFVDSQHHKHKQITQIVYIGALGATNRIDLMKEKHDKKKITMYLTEETELDWQLNNIWPRPKTRNAEYRNRIYNRKPIFR
ncbi:hypothetical protein ACJX0J_015703, partial [Zea mays]